jgi:hypothetical protein
MKLGKVGSRGLANSARDKRSRKNKPDDVNVGSKGAAARRRSADAGNEAMVVGLGSRGTKADES